MMTNKRQRRNHAMWHIPLAVAFLCFGLLMMAQYYTHVAENDSLKNETQANLALIIKGLNDNKQALQSELSALSTELNSLSDAVESGDSLAGSLVTRIETLQAATGAGAVGGAGLSVYIADPSNLIYQDVIDIINELFNAGAEAVCVNDIRITLRTAIGEAPRTLEVYDEARDTTTFDEYYVITVNGTELSKPLVIKAIGDSQTLETALTYPGGVISSFNSLYGVYPIVRQAANLVIPAAVISDFSFSVAPTE